CQQCYSTPYSF
nr:immunoglobulin light chain junction region [Macaca mulatta]